MVRALLLVAVAACHVTTTTETLRPGATQRIRHPEGAVARRPAIVLTDAGALRFVEPLECPTEEVVEQQSTTEIATGPNLATFTVGVVATAIGGLLAVRGAFADSPGSSPYTYAGIAGVGVGLPLAVGPWVGTRTELRGGTAIVPLRRIGPSEPCGDRPLRARAATLSHGGLEIAGAIGDDGAFSVSPFAWLDAFQPTSAPAAELTAAVDADAGARTISAVFDGATLARAAAGFLAHADFDAKIEPMRLVPGIVPGALRASLTSTSAGPALRLVLPLRNDGPGDAYALRGQVMAPGTPAVDGRMIYVGHLAKGASVAREVLVPLTPAAAAQLKNATIELAVELRDAHGTAPTTPVKLGGAIFGDAPR